MGGLNGARPLRPNPFKDPMEGQPVLTPCRVCPELEYCLCCVESREYSTCSSCAIATERCQPLKPETFPYMESLWSKGGNWELRIVARTIQAEMLVLVAGLKGRMSRTVGGVGGVGGSDRSRVWCATLGLAGACTISHVTLVSGHRIIIDSQGYGPAVKVEEEDRHMNVNVSSSGQGTKTVILQIPKVGQHRKFH